ncbi:MAG: hypothetical protein GY791_14995 [Alphaproteobacteria bacterium]|nr:hypothetical protein [Alphaproteobacteria bacterium]
MRAEHSFLLAILCFVCVLCAGQSPAGELPKQGKFEVTIEQDGSWEGFPVAHSYWVWIARREGIFVGTGLLNGMTSKCVSKGKTSHGISIAEIHCENTDSDGDKIFEVSQEECACAPDGEGGTGTGEFLGGTGKYVGIRGSFDIERRVGPRNQAARTWTDHVTIVGSWNRP